MKTKIKIKALLIFTVFAGVFFARVGNTQTQTKAESAGEKFKNIKVLNDMPADQLGKVMNIMSASLGVNCSFCHVVDQWEKDDKKEKETAREMMKMTFGLNKDHFNGRPEISCNTCHNGREHPQSVPNLNPTTEERPKQPSTKPTADQIIEKYLTALGGAAKLAKLNSAQITAIRIEPDGKTEPEMIYFKTNKFATVTTYDKYVITEAYDGSNAWKKSNDHEIKLKNEEIEQIKRAAELFSPANIKTIYSKIDFRFVDRIDGHLVNVVIATTASGLRERLYFDVDSGLLVRRSAATPTVLGNFVYQVDYTDYKDFAGVKVPTKISHSMPNIRWVRKVLNFKSNVQIDDSKFAKPAGNKS